MWILATAVGFAAGLGVGSAVVSYRTDISTLAVMGAITGLAIGVAQGITFADNRRMLLWGVATSGLYALGWCATTLGGISVDKQFMVFDFPFLFNNAQEAYAVSDGPVGQRLMNGLAAHGVVGLGIWDLGFRNMTNSKRPITRVEDLQGLKMRVIASPIYLDMFNTLGANPVPMTFGEVYGALESKAIDGQDNPVGVIESAKFAEVQKFMSLTRHVYTGMPFLMSKKTWDSMSGTERKIITDSASEAKDEERKLSQAKELQSIDKLRQLMQVNDVTAPERDRLRQKVAPVVEKFSREVGDQTIQQVQAELSRMRDGK